APGAFTRAAPSAVSEPCHTMTSETTQYNHYEAKPGTLADQFLIAMPHLEDPWFNHTVTYLWRHDEERALGIVINKPSTLRLADLLEELQIDWSERRGDIDFHSQRVMSAGPVEMIKGFILHSTGADGEYTLPLTPRT